MAAGSKIYNVSDWSILKESIQNPERYLWSSNGEYIAAMHENKVEIYQNSTWDLEKTLNDSLDNPSEMSWSKDSENLAISEGNKTYVYEAESWGQSKVLDDSSKNVTDISWASDGRLAVGNEDTSHEGNIFIYGSSSFNLNHHEETSYYINDISWSSDDRYLAHDGIYSNQKIKILNTSDWTEETVLDKADYNQAFKWSPNGDYMSYSEWAGFTGIGETYVHETGNWSNVTELEGFGYQVNPSWSSNGKFLAIGGGGGNIRVYNRKNGWSREQVIRATDRDQGGNIYYKPDGLLFGSIKVPGSGVATSMVSVHNSSQDWKLIDEMHSYNAHVSQFEFPANGDLMVSFGDNNIRIINSSTWNLKRDITELVRRQEISMSSSGDHVLVASGDGTYQEPLAVIRDTENLDPVTNFSTSQEVAHVDIGPKDDVFAYAEEKGNITVRKFDHDNWDKMYEFDSYWSDESYTIDEVAISPSGNYIAYGLNEEGDYPDNKVEIRSLNTGNLVNTTKFPWDSYGDNFNIQWFQNGDYLVAGDGSSIVMTETSSWKKVKDLESEHDDLAIHPESKYISYVNEDISHIYNPEYHAPYAENKGVEQITHDTAFFKANMTTFGGGELEQNSVKASFEYKKITEDSWSQTIEQDIDSLGKFNRSVTGLEPDSEYKFRPKVTWNEGSQTGDSKTFETLNHAEISTLPLEREEDGDRVLRVNITYLSGEKNYESYFEYSFDGNAWNETQKQDISTKGVYSQNLDASGKAISYRPVVGWDNGNATGEKGSRLIDIWSKDKRGDNGEQYIPTKPIATEDVVFFSGYQSTFARNTSTGELLWENDEANASYLSGMDIHNESLFVPSQSGIYALDIKSGSELWTRNDINGLNLQAEYNDGKIFVGNSSDNRLWALNATTGEAVWNYSGNFDQVASYTRPTANEGVVVAALYNGDESLIALNSTTGEKIWGRGFANTEASPVIRDGKVFAGVSEYYEPPFFRVYNLTNGDTIWTTFEWGSEEYVYTKPEIYNDTVYVATCGNRLLAYDMETGDQKWNRTGFGCSYDVSDPVISDGLLYTTVYSDKHEVLDPETGETLFNYTNPSGCKYTSPAVVERENSENTLFLADRYCDGKTVAFGKIPNSQALSESKEDPRPMISEPSPNNTNQKPGTGVELSVKAEHPENQKMNITFYNSSDDSQIEKIVNVQNGTYSSRWKGLSTDQTYEWYAKITDGSSKTTTDTFSFTTIDINLNWSDNSDNEEGFRIYSNSSGAIKKIKTTEENVESYTDYSQNLEPGKTVQYQVSSYNKYGESPAIKGMITP